MLRFLLLMLTLYALTSQAQDAVKPIYLRVMDGRNGRPVANEDVNFWYDEVMGSFTRILTE